MIKDYIVKNEAVVRSHATSLSNLKNQIGQLATALSNIPQGSLPNNIEDPKREGKKYCKVINLISGNDVHIPIQFKEKLKLKKSHNPPFHKTLVRAFKLQYLSKMMIQHLWIMTL